MELSSNTSDKTVSQANLQRAATYASVCVALFLIGIKVWAWMQTSSVAMLSSLVDSLLDVAASLITLVAVSVALQPPDLEHRFGHGKAEGLAALAQSIIIAGSAVFVFVEAVQRLINPREVDKPEAGIAVMLLSILLTLGIVAFQRFVVKRTGSMAISADASHYQSDLLINLAVLIAIPIAAYSDFNVIDPLLGICVAAFILWTTYGIGANALDVLLDRELPSELRQQIIDIARDHPEVRGCHDLRTRFGGNRYFIQFHLELAAETSLMMAHRISDEVEDLVRMQFPACDIIVHADPEGIEEARDNFS